MTVKKFSRKQIFARRGQFLDILRGHIDQTIAGDVIYEIADNLTAAMPPVVSRNAVFETIRVLAGTQLHARAAAKLAWRLAGNIDLLANGEPVLPWTRQLNDEIVPVCVERVVPMKRKDKSGYLFHYRVLAGTPAAEEFAQFFSANSCRAISRIVGFSTNSWGPYQYAGIGLHFVNLMFFAHVEAARSRDKPVFHRVSVTSSMLKANKELLEVRCRVKPCPPPNNFQHSCVNCWIGYNECAYATHSKSYVEQHCRICNSLAFFDPETPSTMCVNCCRVNRHIAN